jgi:hypothetical protein
LRWTTLRPLAGSDGSGVAVVLVAPEALGDGVQGACDYGARVGCQVDADVYHAIGPGVPAGLSPVVLEGGPAPAVEVTIGVCLPHPYCGGELVDTLGRSSF